MFLKKDIYILSILLFLGGFLSLYIGQNINYNDFYNYHIYNAWAFLTNRLEYDFMPAGIQSYFNPIADIWYYIAIKYFNNHPYLITFIQGWNYSLFIFLTYKLSSLIFLKEGTTKTFFIISTIIVGCSGSASLWAIGILTHDLLVTNFILAALYQLIKIFFINKSFSQKNLIFIGILLGVSMVIKLTTVLFIVGILLALIFFKNGKKPSLIIGLSSIFTFLILDAFWLYKIYSIFKNPFFPYFNNLFNSEFATKFSVLIQDFGYLYPKNIIDYLIRPFVLFYEDPRYVIFYIAVIINIILYFLQFKKYKKILSDYCHVEIIKFLNIFIIFTYVIWILLFAETRYIMVLQVIGMLLLSFLVLFFSLKHTSSKKSYIVIILFITLCFSMTTRVHKVGIPTRETLFQLKDCKLNDKDIVITTHATAIFAVFQNPKVKYINIGKMRFNDENLSGFESFEFYSPKTFNKIGELIKNCKGDIYLIAQTSRDKNELAENLLRLKKSNLFPSLKIQQNNTIYIDVPPKGKSIYDMSLYKLYKD